MPPTDLPALVSVSELNRLARQLLERELPLLWVAGEISNLVRASSGHVYFSLKDETAQIRCALFRNRAQLVPWQLANGQQVEARALVSIYEARGDYQLNVENLRRAGLGRLYEAYTRLRQKLDDEGLFAVDRKNPLPSLPRSIGVITSMQAAALRDVLTTLARRAPNVPVIIYPTPVQGEGVGEQIARTVATAARHGACDVLLLVRGGGSLEDLWAFNDEGLARAIATCPIPLIAGVGHETDTTIADQVADLRAPTPTAAAELASSGWFAAASELAGIAVTLRICGDAAIQQQTASDGRSAASPDPPGQPTGTGTGKTGPADQPHGRGPPAPFAPRPIASAGNPGWVAKQPPASRTSARSI